MARPTIPGIDGDARLGRPLAAGREAEIFEHEDGWVLRLAHTAAQREQIEREHAAITAARRLGAPVPAVRDQVIEVDGRPGFVLERLESRDLLIPLVQGPWRLPAVARRLAAVHSEIHRIEAPEDFPAVRSLLAEQLRSPLVPDDQRDAAKRLLDSLPEGDRLCHGDFHPGNLLPSNGGHVAIDWTAATRGHPDADVARTLVLVRHSAMPAEPRPPLAWVLPTGRRLLAALYVRAYRRRRTIEADSLSRWFQVCATARLAEDIEGERDDLLAALSRARRA